MLEILDGSKKGLCRECNRNNVELHHFKVDGREEIWICTECQIDCLSGKPLKILEKLRTKLKEEHAARGIVHVHSPQDSCFPDCHGWVPALYKLENVETKIPGVTSQRISPKPLPMFCPVCNKVKFITNLYGFVEYQRMLQKYSMETAGKINEDIKGVLQDNSSDLAVTLTEANLLHILSVEGYFTFPCPPCQAELSAEMYRQNGLDCVAIGMNVVATEMLEKYPEKVAQLKASQGTWWVE